jgi:hypothetical protein
LEDDHNLARLQELSHGVIGGLTVHRK